MHLTATGVALTLVFFSEIDEVPVPGTLVLLGLGLAATGFTRKNILGHP